MYEIHPVMKNLFLLISVFILIACNQNKSITITGKITNPDSDVITLDLPYNHTKDTIATIAEDGSFSANIEITEAHLANFINGDAYLQLHLIPGSTLDIRFDGIKLKKGELAEVLISGNGSANSNLLLEIRGIKPDEDLRTLLALPAPIFENKVTKPAQSISEKLNDYELAYPDQKKFIEMLHLEQKVQLAQKYDYFVMYHSRFAPNDTLPVPEEYKTFTDAIPTDHYEAFKEIRSYQYFLVNQQIEGIETQLKENGLNNGSVDYTNKQFDAIAALNIPQMVKDEIGNRLLGSYTYEPDSIKKVMKSRYSEIILNEKYTKAFKDLLAQLEKLQPGAVAPTFAYNDINGEQITSEDLKGKVIYIDVWATWCGPCKAEIPHLKTMEEELHDQNIAFVSISVDNDKSAWEKMVEEKELKGYQLFAPEAWESEIIKNYAIRGIPRFIMIDKEGKLVNANATRPSNPETKEKLRELANS